MNPIMVKKELPGYLADQTSGSFMERSITYSKRRIC